MADFHSIPPGSNIKTFQFDADLPSLPVPSLDHTLQRYLDSVEPFLSKEEFAHTQEIVEKFRHGEGKELNELLRQRASKLKNWLEEWWENYAYLENRQPLLPFCSMTGMSDFEEINWKAGKGQMIKRAALYTFYMIKMWELLRTEELMPAQTPDGKIKFSMVQFRRLFNCSRTPLPKRDRIDAFFKTESEGSCPSHVIVQCNGHLYLIDAVDSVSGSTLTPPEWELQFYLVLKEAESSPGPGLGRLTCDDRDLWAKNRSHLQRLSSNNGHYLDLIDTALFVLSLDSEAPQNEPELNRALICGDYSNRWADKSVSLVFFESGLMGGISEHTAYDGIVSMISNMYILQQLVQTGGVYRGPNKIRPLRAPKQLDFTLDDTIQHELDVCDVRQNRNKQSVIITRESFTKFGKKAITKHRIHPDTFVQLVLQLAYYSLHGKLAPCYETATTRTYHNGRTETHRPCTKECAQWVYAMENPSITVEEKVRLMRVAAKKNDELMKDARENRGCDRHLFGLYCTALETGRPIPELYSDPAYVKSGGGGNFVLSTSLVGFYPSGGGMAAMTKEGYGVFYNIRPESIHFTLSAQREGETTSTSKYFQRLCVKFEEVLHTLDTCASKTEVKSKI